MCHETCLIQNLLKGARTTCSSVFSEIFRKSHAHNVVPFFLAEFPMRNSVVNTTPAFQLVCHLMMTGSQPYESSLVLFGLLCEKKKNNPSVM